MPGRAWTVLHPREEFPVSASNHPPPEPMNLSLDDLLSREEWLADSVEVEEEEDMNFSTLDDDNADGMEDEDD